MNIGLLVEVEEGLTWERWRAICGAAEKLGFESLWVSDHLCSPWSSAGAGLDAWVALGVAAAETHCIALGTLVSPVTFRPPGVLARMAESVQALSGGRLTVGLGLGWNAAEHRAFGIPFPPIGERARLLEQTVGLLDGVAPVLIGGMGEQWTLPLVARWADEWNLTTSSVEVYVAKSQVLARLCAAAGRDALHIRRSVAAGFLIGHDTDDLWRRLERMQAWVPPLRGRGLDAAREMGWLVGTPGDVKHQLAELAMAGVGRVMLGHYAQDDLQVLELVAQRLT
jgi:alkanesulfonate monooxygenase SsuD/methylene tetrahydromethanopterin reductase-like flavin-dependent oxidoreductase (luciferase family)